MNKAGILLLHLNLMGHGHHSRERMTMEILLALLFFCKLFLALLNFHNLNSETKHLRHYA